MSKPKNKSKARQVVADRPAESTALAVAGLVAAVLAYFKVTVDPQALVPLLVAIGAVPAVVSRIVDAVRDLRDG